MAGAWRLPVLDMVAPLARFSHGSAAHRHGSWQRTMEYRWPCRAYEVDDTFMSYVGLRASIARPE